jgi:hypothetical protein
MERLYATIAGEPQQEAVVQLLPAAIAEYDAE